MNKRYAVVGAGLSGLAVAHQLTRSSPGSTVKVFEANERAGGVIHTEVVETSEGRFVLDHGADMFAVDPPAAIELCEELGVENELIVPESERAGAMIVHRGGLVPIPDGFVLMRATKLGQMVTTPLLSVGGKLRFLAERFVPSLPQHTSDRRNEDLKSIDDVSVGDFVRHRMGQETLERLVGPLVAGIYTADVDRLSLHATMGPIVSMVRKHGSLTSATLARRKGGQDETERGSAGARYGKFRGFKNGMKQLIDRLVDSIGDDALHLNSPVTGLRFHSQANEWCLQRSTGDESFDEVILTTPPSATARLLESISGLCDHEDAVRDAASNLRAIESASTAIVILCVRKSKIHSLPNKFGFVVPMIEKRRILAVSFASHKYACRCPEDHTIIRVFVGGAMQPELLQHSDDELVRLVRDELKDLIGLEGPETLARVVRWNEAMPQYNVGHLQLAAKIEQCFNDLPHLHLATNALHGVGIAPVIANARRVAGSLSC
ncbi:MAG: protoporphyrinogen oxidase [Planctomycetota bacterium]